MPKSKRRDDDPSLEDQQAAEAMANQFRDLVLKRTGLTKDQLQCPREKSDMTPCLARDGGLVVVFSASRGPICVGCEASLTDLLAKEQARHGR